MRADVGVCVVEEVVEAASGWAGDGLIDYSLDLTRVV